MTGWDRLRNLLDVAPGDYSLCVYDVEGVRLYGYQEHVVRSAASLIKVPLVMAMYDTRPHTLDAPLTLREQDRVEGEGTFDRSPSGTVKTVRELVGYAFRESDNTAANLLIDQVGVENVNAWLERIGLQTRLRRKFMDYAALAAGRDNTTTAADMCAIFHQLMHPRYAELLALLRTAVGNQKLEAGLPEGTVIAHKVGDLPNVEHDVGIVFAPGRPYIVTALSVALPDGEVGRRTIATASSMIWQLMIES